MLRKANAYYRLTISAIQDRTVISYQSSCKQENQTYCLQWTPKSSILLSGIDWYSEGPSSGGL